MEPLIRIIYTSEARASLSGEELQLLVADARQYNQKTRITGILCHGKKDFIQVLEGPENLVYKLYSKILDDLRHEKCKLIYIGLTEKRVFPQWSMGFINISAARMEQLRRELPAKLGQDNTEKLVIHLRSFLNATLAE